MADRIPARLLAYLGLTALVAAILMLAAALEFSGSSAKEQLWLVAILFVLIALATRFPLHMATYYQQELSPAPGVAAVLLLDPPLAVAVCVLGHLAAQATRPNRKFAGTLFNGSVVAIQAGGASLTMQAVTGRAAIDSTGDGMIAFAAAITVWFISGSALVEGAVAMHHKRPPGYRWLERHLQPAVIELSLLFLGGLAALVALSDPWLLPLMGVPLAAVVWGFSNQQLNLHRAQVDKAFAERRRETAESERERFTEIVDATPDVVITLTSDSKIQYLNPAAKHLLGAPPAREPAAFSIEQIFPDWKRSALVASYEGTWSGETEVNTPAGPVPVSQVVIVHRGRGGAVDFISTVSRDIRERKAYEQKLVHLADHDALTGAFNRRRFDEEVARALEHAQHTRRQGAVMYIDLDGFKDVNDQFGHEAGDRLLRSLVATLQAHPPVRDGGLLGRLGGDEFALLFRNVTPTDASLLARDVLSLIKALRIQVRAGEASVTGSIGVAVFSGRSSCDEVLARADSAMYVAKRAGNRVVFAGSSGSRLSA